MSTTDTRSGFRLPWSSDRSRDDDPQTTPVDSATEPVEADETVAPALSEAPDAAWPDVDVAARLHAGPAGDASAGIHDADPADHPFAAPTNALPTVPRKPSKLMAELVTAMRSTAEVAREQALSQVEAEAQQVVEAIKKGATDGAAALRRRSDEDIAGIREWSKAEIARIREQTDLRIAERKATLEAEIAEHTAVVDRRVELVNAAVEAYESEMAGFFERLLAETDPARLATMAEAMPEPPALGEFATSPAEPVAVEAPDWEADTTAAGAAAGLTTDALDTGTGWDTGREAEIATDGFEPADAEMEAAIAAEAAADAGPDPEPARDPDASSGPWGNEDGATTGFAATPWGNEDGAFETAEPADGRVDPDLPRWVAGTEDDLATGPNATPGAPVDRGSIMAALEAAAEAVVAAEAAAESADQAEAAADVAETAAELIVGRVDSEEEEHEAEAALAARMDAGGLDREPSLADRLASLLPGAGSGESDGTPTTTQVVVTGLVSVASIASFKRHLGRAHGVQSVTVASGPDGEFVFNVTHRGDSGLRDAIPALPGFAARVTGTGEGVLNVAARDPETEA